MSADPYGHFLVIDAKVMRNLVQNSVLYLLANSIGISIAIGYNRVLVDGDDLRMWDSSLTIRGQRHTFVESQ